MSRERFEPIRDRIVHNYEGVHLVIVWDTIQNDSPKLLELLESI